MSNRKLRVGLIGSGRIAQAHLKAAAHLEDHVQLSAVSDTVREKAEQAAATYGIPRATTDYREILADPAIQAVVVTVPNDLHAQVVCEAARAGKHILVEKPMSLDAAGAEQMVLAAEAAGVTLMVGQSRRFPDAAQELVRRLPDVGQILRIHILFLVAFPQPPTDWWKSQERAGGLVILLQASHSLDSLHWWLKEAPSWVFATATRTNPAWEGEDEADIVCRFRSGIVGTVHLSLSTDPAVHEWIVVGRQGHLRLAEHPAGIPFENSYRLEQNGRVVMEGFQSPSMYTHQMREFVTALREKRVPTASGREVLPVQRTLDAARESARTGQPVRLED